MQCARIMPIVWQLPIIKPLCSPRIDFCVQFLFCSVLWHHLTQFVMCFEQAAPVLRTLHGRVSRATIPATTRREWRSRHNWRPNPENFLMLITSIAIHIVCMLLECVRCLILLLQASDEYEAVIARIILRRKSARRGPMWWFLFCSLFDKSWPIYVCLEPRMICFGVRSIFRDYFWLCFCFWWVEQRLLAPVGEQLWMLNEPIDWHTHHVHRDLYI